MPWTTSCLERSTFCQNSFAPPRVLPKTIYSTSAYRNLHDSSKNINTCVFFVFWPLSGPILRDTARLSQRSPPIARYGVFGVSTWPIGCDTPSPFSERFPLGEHSRSGGAIPPLKKGISAILARYPMKTRQMGAIPPFAILSRKGLLRYGGVSRIGPLSLAQKNRHCRTQSEVDKQCPTIARLAILFRATPPLARKASEASFFGDTPLLGLSLDFDRPLY